MTETGGVVTILLAGFGGLWLYFRATNEARLSDLRQGYTDRLADRDRHLTSEREDHAKEIAERDARIRDLEAKVDGLNQTVAKNTQALETSAEALQAISEMFGSVMDAPEPGRRRTPTPPRLTDGRRRSLSD
jgi:TolA-binding protein